MKIALAVLASLPLVAKAGVEHRGFVGPIDAPRASVAHQGADRHSARNHRFDQWARFFAKHMRGKPGRCSV